LAELFGREVLRLLVGRELMSPERAERILSWPHSGFNVHSYYGLYANAHRGKVRKASLAPSLLRIIEEEFRRLPAKGWAAMIRKVYELTFVAERPPPPAWDFRDLDMVADPPAEYVP
jgi:hypothetical protein